MMKSIASIVALIVAVSAFAAGTNQSHLVIGEVHAPRTAKGPSGSIVWTNDFGFVVKHRLKSEPEYFVYRQNPPDIRHTKSFEQFLRHLQQLPIGAKLDWVNTCCVPVSAAMPPEHHRRLEATVKKKGMTLLKTGEGATLICRCESTNTIWYTETKKRDANM